MAKYSTKKFKKMSYQDMTKMTRDEMIEAMSKPQEAARKRISNLKKAGFEKTPATMGFESAGGTYKHSELKNLSRNQILNRMASLKDFLNAKTSTVTGAKSWLSNVQNSMTQKQKAQWNKFNDTQKSNIWSMVDWIRNNHTGEYENLGSDRVIALVESVMDTKKKNKAKFKNKKERSDFLKTRQQDVIDVINDAYNEKMQNITSTVATPIEWTGEF